MLAVIDAIRDTGATQPILVPGITYGAKPVPPAYGGGPAVGWLIDAYRPRDRSDPPSSPRPTTSTTTPTTRPTCKAPTAAPQTAWDKRLGIVVQQHAKRCGVESLGGKPDPEQAFTVAPLTRFPPQCGVVADAMLPVRSAASRPPALTVWARPCIRPRNM
jgi:hypothetical protein